MIFKENKYKKWYFDIIQNRQKHPIPLGEYGETHHILPKSLGGSNDRENLVRLTAKEHFICHLLLIRMTEGDAQYSMIWAVHRMCNSSINYINSNVYEYLRKKFSMSLKENHHSKRIENWNQKMSDTVFKTWEDNEERRKNTSDRMKLTWKNNYERMKRHSVNISKKGAEAAKIKLSKKIEYKGTIYIGWQDLQNKTGVTKFLYKKYYLKGFDPTDRIGKDGNPSKNFELKPLDRKESQ